MGRNGDEENVHRAVETIQILQSMYSLPGESELSPDTHEFLSHWSETPQDGEVSPLAPRQLELTINLELDGSEEHILQVSAEIPLHIGHPTLTPKQPVWLSKGEFDGLINSGGEAPNSPDILDDIVHQLEELKSMTERISMSKNDYESTPNEEGAEQVERVWFWFPSLSSKEKRRDLVDYALENSLTGFIVAGKPGLLCVEGSGKKVDQYMADIKSRSWSDIPAYQKKVTERLRKPIEGDKRKFTSMTDITTSITHYGRYDHRGEMGEVRKFLDQHELGDEFSTVIMNG